MRNEVNSVVCAKVNELIGAMTKSCMSPGEIAAAAGVSVNVVYRMRRGYLVRMEYFGKICRVLGIDAEGVIDYERLQEYMKGESSAR